MCPWTEKRILHNFFNKKQIIYPGACIRPILMQFLLTHERKSKMRKEVHIGNMADQYVTVTFISVVTIMASRHRVVNTQCERYAARGALNLTF